jgi:ubiquitin-conjugating enzyme E2 O
MQNATGQLICWRDFVRLNSPAAGATRDRGLVLKGMPGSKVAVQCLDGTRAIENARDVRVADRSNFFPGMVVASASDRGGQLGVVTGAAVELDLVRLGRDDAAEVARGVSPAELRRVREFCPGDYVVSGPWLGRVFEVSLDVDVVFDGGASVCRVTAAGGKLRPVKVEPSNRYNDSVFFPGQRVRGSSSVFEDARWLKGYWKRRYRKGTVSKVETAAVLVYWVASSQLGAKRSVVQASTAPAHQQSPRDLTFFRAGNYFTGFWGVGDRCFFRAPCRRGVHPAGDVGAANRPELAAAGGQAHAATRKPEPRRVRAAAVVRRRNAHDGRRAVAGRDAAVPGSVGVSPSQRATEQPRLLPGPARRQQDVFAWRRRVFWCRHKPQLHGTRPCACRGKRRRQNAPTTMRR